MISNSWDDPNLVYHVLNPRRFHWTKDIIPELRSTKLPHFEVVGVREWLQRLHSSDPDPSKNPTAKLYDFYYRKYISVAGLTITGTSGLETQDAQDDATGLIFETQKTIEHCPLLGAVPDLIQRGYISRYVDTWLGKWGV